MRLPNGRSSVMHASLTENEEDNPKLSYKSLILRELSHAHKFHRQKLNGKKRGRRKEKGR